MDNPPMLAGVLQPLIAPTLVQPPGVAIGLVNADGDDAVLARVRRLFGRLHQRSTDTLALMRRTDHEVTDMSRALATD